MTALCFIRRANILWYFSDRNTVVSCALQPTAMSDMEVTDETEFLREVKAALGPNTFKSPVQTILLLSDELCFTRTVPAVNANDTLEKEASDLPFTHATYTTVRSKDTQTGVLTNADLYETITRIIQTFGYTVNLVLPWRAVVAAGVSAHGEFDAVTIHRIFDSVNTLKPFAFPLDAEHISEEKPSDSKEPAVKKKLPIGWIVFVAIAVIYAAAMLVFFMRK